MESTLTMAKAAPAAARSLGQDDSTSPLSVSAPSRRRMSPSAAGSRSVSQRPSNAPTNAYLARYASMRTAGLV